MVESKERKSAFLREAIRVLHVVRANVFTGRFEDAELIGLDAVTIRAVKLDASAVSVIGRMLRKDGLLMVFGSAHSWAGFLPDKTVQLPGSDSSKLLVLRKL
jgi:16S rRNA G527 N7-methylase RsmG